MTDTFITISLIPHTYEQTVLGFKKRRMIVNIETDLIGKYVKKHLQNQTESTITMDFLQRTWILKEWNKMNTIEEAIQALKNGEIIIVSDDENRENEGDFLVLGEFATPENINFMALYGRGLICTPISSAIAEKLSLHPMVQSNTDTYQTAFTISIDHIHTTTGISAFERSKTMLAL